VIWRFIDSILAVAPIRVVAPYANRAKLCGDRVVPRFGDGGNHGGRIGRAVDFHALAADIGVDGRIRVQVFDDTSNAGNAAAAGHFVDGKFDHDALQKRNSL
jgi:hypothetical protein